MSDKDLDYIFYLCLFNQNKNKILVEFVSKKKENERNLVKLKVKKFSLNRLLKKFVSKLI
jgi:hypothetical protein